MKKLRWILTGFAMMLSLLVFVNHAFGQGPPNPNNGPVGGGLIFLLISGILVGLFRLNKKDRP